MKRLLVAGWSVAAVIAACGQTHDVRVLLGPDDQTLTIGFRCRSEATGEPLFMRAVAGRHFALVIDLITIQSGSPGCRGEELLATCTNADNCRLQPGRYCVDVPFSDLQFDPQDPSAALDALGEYLRRQDPVITADAPDKPTLVRVVATTQYCADIADGPLTDLDAVTGCAYSCPTLLDEVQGSVSVSLDALSDFCEGQVRVCAAFPRRAVMP